MSKVRALSTVLLGTLALGLGGCRAAQNQAETTEKFTIQKVEIDSQGDQLKLAWSASKGSDMYRVWVSRTGDCKDSVVQVAVQKTEQVFKDFGPGTFYACVQAVPNYSLIAQSSCSDDAYDVDGVGYPAENQGQPFQVESPTGGSWKKLMDNRPYASILSRAGGIILSANQVLYVHDEEGKTLLEAKILTGIEREPRYAFAQGRLLVLAQGKEGAFLAVWDVKTQGWLIQSEYPGLEPMTIELVAPTQIIILLRSIANRKIDWVELDPLALNTPKLVSSIAIAEENVDILSSVTSTYRAGSFVVGDWRGLHSLSPAGIKTLVVQSRLSASHIYQFPGTSQDILVRIGYPSGLRAAPLICSIIYREPIQWLAWNGTDAAMKPFEKSSGEYELATSEGLVGMRYRHGGNSLYRWKEGKQEMLLAPPFTDGGILGGEAAFSDGRVLVSHGSEVWVYSPGSN